MPVHTQSGRSLTCVRWRGASNLQFTMTPCGKPAVHYDTLCCCTQIEADQERTTVTSWPCNPEPVHGSDASQFQPGLTSSSPVEVWISDLFQARRLVVNSTVDLHGVELLRYWLVSLCLYTDVYGVGGGHGLVGLSVC